MVYLSMGNLAWCFVIGAAVLSVFLVYGILKRQDGEGRRKGLLYLAVGIAFLFFVHRFFLFRYEEFREVYGTGFQTKMVELLPLQLCNIGVLLAIAGLWRKKPALLSFCFYISSIGAIAAILVPEGIYMDTNLLEPAVLLFYLFHAMILALYFNIGLLGLAEWKWRSGFWAIAILFVMTAVIHGVNLLGQEAGFTGMNYFYTLHPSGSAALEIFWKWIPVPCLYLYPPGIIIALLWEALLITLYKARQALCRRKRQNLK